MAWLLAVVLAGSGMIPSTGVSAAKKPKLNKKKATITVGKTVKLKVKNKKKSVKWSTSNKKVATVSKSGLVKGKKKGKATITAKTGGRKLKCKVTVKAKKNNNGDDDAEETDGPNGTKSPQPSAPAAPTATGSQTPPAQESQNPDPTGTDSGSTGEDTPEPTDQWTIEPTGGGEGINTPEPSGGEEGSDTPGPSGEGEGSDTPDPSATTESTNDPEETEEPTEEPTPTQEPTQTPWSTAGSETTGEEVTAAPTFSAAPARTAEPTYQVKINVALDGNEEDGANLGKSFLLYNMDTNRYSSSTSVRAGEYKIFERTAEGKYIDTGISLTVSPESENLEATVEYFSVIFMDGAVEMATPPRQIVLKGQKAEKPPRTQGRYDTDGGNYSLDKWTVDPEGTEEFYFTQREILRQTYVYAQWKEDSNVITYSIEYHLENLNGGYDLAERESNLVGHRDQPADPPKEFKGFTAQGTEGTNLTYDGQIVTYYYTRNSYTITWKTGAGTFSDGKASRLDEVKYEADITAPTAAEITPPLGYKLNQTDPWDPPVPAKMLADNAEYTAQYEPIVYKIEYVWGGIDVTRPDGSVWPGEYTIEDESYTLPEPERQGYDFAGWTEGNGGTPQKEMTIQKGVTTGDKVYTANWTPRSNTKYTVKHYKEVIGQTEDVLADTETLYGTTDTTVQVPIKKYEHYVAPEVQSLLILANGTAGISYHYKLMRFNLKWELDGGRIEDTDYTLSGEVRYGEKIIAPKTVTKQGYVFDGWDKTVAETMPEESVTYTAKWKPGQSKYTVKHCRQNLSGAYDYNDNNLVETEELTGTTGSKVTPTRKSYVGFDQPSTQTVEIGADGKTVVKYEYPRKSYTLTWDGNGGTIGTMTKKTETLKYQATLTPPTATRTGYTLAGWKDAQGNSLTATTTMPAGNVTFTAQWTANSGIKYIVRHCRESLTGSYEDKSLIEEVSGTGTAGAKVTPELKTYTGFKQPSKQTVEIKADGSTVIIYKYERMTYKLTWDTAGGKITGSYTSGDVRYEEPINPPADGTVKKDGYTFVGWDPTPAKTMPAKDQTYTAKWEAAKAESYTVTLNVYKDDDAKTGNSSFLWKNCDRNFALYTDNGEFVKEFDGTNPLEVESGSYRLRDNGVDVGAVTASNPTVTLHYYTMSYYVVDALEDSTILLYEIVLRDGEEIPEPIENKMKGYVVPEGEWYTTPTFAWGTEAGFGPIHKKTSYYGDGRIPEYSAHLDLDGGKFNTDTWTRDYPEWITEDGTIVGEDEGEWYVKYYEGSGDSTLPQPYQDGNTFIGWTGDNGNTPQKTVTIPAGLKGDRNYKANWSSEGGSSPDITPTPGGSGSSQTVPPASAADTLTVGKISVKLGMSKEEVEKAAGGKPTRTEKSPLGFDVYIYNPSGDYTNYLMLQFDGANGVVGMSTISAYFTYEDKLTAGKDTVSTLTGNGFSRLSGYDYEKGYKLAGDNEYILAFIDHQGSGTLYAAEIFAKKTSKSASGNTDLDDLFKVESCQYDSSILAAQRQQLFDWACAFRAAKKLPLFVADGKDGAQKHSDDMAKNGFVGTDSSGGQKMSDRFDGQYTGWMGAAECVAGRSPDAFAFVTWILDDTSDTKPYNNLTKTADKYGESIRQYYLNTGFSYNAGQKDKTFAALDLYFY